MTELMVIFVIGLVVLGPKRLPSLARSLGRSLAEFRRASTALRADFLDVADDLRATDFEDDDENERREAAKKKGAEATAPDEANATAAAPTNGDEAEAPSETRGG